MQVLVPHLSCVVTPGELQTAIEAGYGEIYIITTKGPYKRMTLTHGRHIQVKVPAVPGVTDDVSEVINFLPAGKIPYALLGEIVKFFRAVMTVKKADQEAMAHILWNPTDGYHIGIPTQSVSKASVRYDFDDVKTGDVIVLDIHSHNTMGAFFSGTDNNDDQRSICYSGVAGNLDKPEPAFVWRFNMRDVKIECKLSDIFDVEIVSPEVNPEWLQKVTTGYSPHSGHFNKGEPYRPKDVPPWKNQSPVAVRGPGFYHGGEGLSSRPTQSESAGRGPKQGSFGFNQEQDFASRLGVSEAMSDEAWAEYEAAFEGYYKTSPNDSATDGKDRDPIRQILTEAELRLTKALDDGEDEPAGIIRRVPGQIALVGDPEDADPVGAPEYISSEDRLIYEFGPTAVDAFEQIEAYLQDLEGADALLMVVVKAAYEMLSDEGQAHIQTNGL